MFIAIDFDGTIVDHQFPNIGKPVPDAIKWLKIWQECGAKIILWTMRSDGREGHPQNPLSDAVKFLEDNGISLYGINEHPGQSSWTSSPKAYAAIYIDDAAFGCPLIQLKDFDRPCVDWSIVGPEIHSRLIHKVVE